MRIRRVIRVRPGECVVVCCDRRSKSKGPKPPTCAPCRWQREVITNCRRRRHPRDYFDDY